ncbi:hypothetical protein [Maritalea porphyrae]|uniref:hypothetical protein n=1 Tax=Maritalea porphyrae TaxID=880732 RepID=UPI0022AEEAD8|nr:hypothetical protein [Maritalea porphyrae]MCZ4273376.1 hypothetical protein [Maritalea porphyrae]
MKIIVKRGYCPKCLLELGIQNTPEHLKTLEDANKFPRRVGPLTWEADQIDRWLEILTGIKPSQPDCDC